MKTRRGQITSVVVVLAIAIGSLVYTFVAGNAPKLGLDLAGGLSVVLKPKAAASDENLQQGIAIIRQRIDAVGVAEPEISRQGDNILIQMPGVENKEKVLQLVGQTSELRFRPVISSCTIAPEPTTTTAPPGSAPPGSAPLDPNASTSVAPTPSDPNAPPTTATPASIAPSVAPSPAPDAPAQGALGLPAGESAAAVPVAHLSVSDGPVRALPVQQPVPGDPTGVPTAPGGVPGQQPVPGDPTGVPTAPGGVPGQQQVPGDPTGVPTVPGGAAVPGGAGAPGQPTAGGGAQPIFQGACPANVNEMLTKPEAEKPEETAILPGFEDKDDPNKMTSAYQLGPVNGRGNILEDASAGLGQNAQWVVRPKFKPGKDGIDVFNASAQICKPAGAQCPTGQQAITLDGRVVSAPRIQPDEGQGGTAFKPFSADQVEISGSFNETTAKDLATKLKYGALPVEFQQQQIQEVSATLGRDALAAGLVSGFVGLAIVALYMIAFYRMLGAMAVFKLFIEAAILWSFIALLGSSVGLALTLAGVTGLIVSIGTSLDSNVVYYEHLKEDLRNGRTLRSSVDKAFKGSFSTILKADGVSILGAGLLYMLSVGPVRGFAFYLILAEVLDLFTSRWFMYPAVLLVCRSKIARNRPGLFGLPGAAEVDASGDAAPRTSDRSIPARPSRSKARAPSPERRKKESGAASTLDPPIADDLPTLGSDDADDAPTEAAKS